MVEANMEKKVSRVPFRVLAEHGVPKAQIAMLEYRFGKLVPYDVDGPDDMIQWAFGILPWSEQAPVLRGWVTKAFKRGGIEPGEDARARRTLEALIDPPTMNTQTAADVAGMLETLTRVRGIEIPPEMDADQLSQLDLGDDLRAWAAAHAAVTAANASVGHRFTDQVATRAAYLTYHWVTSQGGSEDAVYNDCVKDVFAHLSCWLGTWVKGAHA